MLDAIRYTKRLPKTSKIQNQNQCLNKLWTNEKLDKTDGHEAGHIIALQVQTTSCTWSPKFPKNKMTTDFGRLGGILQA